MYAPGASVSTTAESAGVSPQQSLTAQTGPLSKGGAGSGKVICPLHAHKFNRVTGEGREKGECVKTYKVSEANGEIVQQG